MNKCCLALLSIKDREFEFEERAAPGTSSPFASSHRPARAALQIEGLGQRINYYRDSDRFPSEFPSISGPPRPVPPRSAWSNFGSCSAERWISRYSFPSSGANGIARTEGTSAADADRRAPARAHAPAHVREKTPTRGAGAGGRGGDGGPRYATWQRRLFSRAEPNRWPRFPGDIRRRIALHAQKRTGWLTKRRRVEHNVAGNWF